MLYFSVMSNESFEQQTGRMSSEYDKKYMICRVYCKSVLTYTVEYVLYIPDPVCSTVEQRSCSPCNQIVMLHSFIRQFQLSLSLFYCTVDSEKNLENK